MVEAILNWMKKDKGAAPASSASPLDQRSSVPRPLASSATRPSFRAAPRSSHKHNGSFIDSSAVGFPSEGSKNDSIWHGNSKSSMRSKFGNSKSAAQRQKFPWADMVARFGEEIGTSARAA